MTAALSDDWFTVFPTPRIPAVLTYIGQTWDWLRNNYSGTVGFNEDEPTLTDNLCEALADPDRRFANRMDCDFQAETWELRRLADGKTIRIARADIRVIFGAPGTPHFVVEFKKLDGTAQARWRYCHDGLNRFIDGKYAVGHVFGAMCAFTCAVPVAEAAAMATYIAQPGRAATLNCVDATGTARVIYPSVAAPATAAFDTLHDRPTLTASNPITLLHIFLPC